MSGAFEPGVWSPHASSIILVTRPGDNPTAAPSHTPMVRRENGWWYADQPLPFGVDYAFALDGASPLPDPRSAWQPDGVHTFSRSFDSEAYRWHDSDWAGRDARNAVTYELHVGTFTPEGTFDAAIGRLDHLCRLGIDMIELMPVAAFPGERGWGYDGVALYAVHAAYGGPAALQRFVDAAHGRGIGVCLDVVYNHLGPSGNYLGQFGPYFTDRHETPWGQAINLDGSDSHEVRRFIIDNACRWFRDFHLDALRLDAVHALVDDSERHVLAELADEVAVLADTLARPLSLVAESDMNLPKMVRSTARGGLGMTAQWADDVHHAIHALVSGERHGYYVDFGSLEVLKKALTEVFVHDGGYSTFRKRNWGAPVPRDIDANRFIICASNHDQVGNRALGDRPSQTLDNGLLAISAALVLTSICTPMIFMGEEWGAGTPWQFFTDHQEDELGRLIREGRQREFGDHGWDKLYGGAPTVPDPQARSTFERSKLDWKEPEIDEHGRLLEWYRCLIALRHQYPDLSCGRFDSVAVRYDESDRWVLISRNRWRIVINLGTEPAVVPVADVKTLEHVAAWPAQATDIQYGDGDAVVLTPRQSVRILKSSA